jgi:hypothetical protein
MSANNSERSRPPRASRYHTNNTGAGAKSYTTAPLPRGRTESVESVASTVPSFRSFIPPPPSYSCNRYIL